MIISALFIEKLIFYFVAQPSTTTAPPAITNSMFCRQYSKFLFRILAISYNQPKLSPYATWHGDVTTFATSSTIGTNPYGIYISTNNTIYVADRQNGHIQIWLNREIGSTSTVSTGLLTPFSLFVISNGDIYIENGNLTSDIVKWSMATSTSTVVMRIGQKCYSIFIAIDNTLYCSMSDYHQVVTRSFNSNSDVLTIIAGTGCRGSTATMLKRPHGIFVTINLDLYVADCDNNRIQLFQANRLDGLTVAGTGAPDTISLNCPTGVTFDYDNHIFIVDHGNNRVVGSSPNGFRCLIGCYGSGLGPETLLKPRSMAFDTYGNIYVTDSDNHRIQKFILSNNTDSKYY